MTDFSKCPIGTKVTYKWGSGAVSEGIIFSVNNNMAPYCICVGFSDGRRDYDMSNGKPDHVSTQCLELAEPEIKVEPAIIRYANVYKDDVGNYELGNSRLYNCIGETKIQKSNDWNFVKTIAIEIQPERKFKKVVTITETWEEVK